MTQPTRTDKQAQADQRRARLEAELRANLKKRKQHTREHHQDAASHRTAEDTRRGEQGSR